MVEIPNPALVLSVLLAVLFICTGLCIYLVVRLIQGVGQRKKGSSARDGGRLASGTAPVGESGPSEADLATMIALEARKSAEPDGAVEVMRVLRTGPSAELVVEVAHQRYRRIADIRDGATGRRVMQAIEDLVTFAGLGSTVRPTEAAPVLRARDGGQSVIGEPLEPSIPGGIGLQAPEGGVVEFWRRGLSRSRRQQLTVMPQPQGLLEQLEELLQEEMALHPEMANRSVHLRGDAMGEVRIEVDGVSYPAVDQVPDAEVVGVVRAALHAWNAI